MNAVVRRTLCDLIDKYGADLCDAPRRCEGLLRDFCGQYRGEIKVLVDALEEGITTDLRSSHSVPQEVVQGRLVKRLQENLLLTEEVAKWVVESWAIALKRAPAANPSSERVTIEPIVPDSEPNSINSTDVSVEAVPGPAPLHPPDPDPVKLVHSGPSALTYVLGIVLLGTALITGLLLFETRQRASANNEQVESLEQQLNEARQRAGAANEQIASAKAEVNSLKQEKDSLEQQVDSLKQEKDSLEQQKDRLETAVTESIGAAPREFFLHNKCSQSIEFALRYRNRSESWESSGWWEFSANESAYLASDGKRIQVTSPIYYYYAETPDKDHIWAGEDSFTLGERTLPMRIDVATPESDVYRLSLTCDSTP
jgi:hypothetical protein